MVLDEGKNREIRRMLAQLGHKVHQLKRVAVGKLSLGDLLPGQWRLLAWSEVEGLRKDALAQTAGLDAGPPRGAHGPRPQGNRRPFSQRGDDRRSGRPAVAGGRPPRSGGSTAGRGRVGSGSLGRGSLGRGSVGRGSVAPSGPGGRGRTAPPPAGRTARPRFLDRAEGAGAPAGGRRPPTGRPPRPPREDEGTGRPPRPPQGDREDRPARPRFLDRAEGAGPPPAGGRRPPTGRPPRPPRDGEGTGRPPRPPRGDGSARPPRPAGQDDSRPPLPGGRRKRPGKASTWRKKKDS
jgi:23S rRNA pseudouridine2605 synthase